MSCNPFSVRPKRTEHPARAARRLAFVVGLMSTLFLGSAFAAEFEGPILGNPAEKFFDETPSRPTPKRNARFSDNEIPSASQAGIRQTSGAAPSVWDNPAPAIAKETTLADWGVGPSLVAPAIGDSTTPNTASPAFTPPNGAAMGSQGYPAQQGFGFGVGPTWGQAPTANPTVNPYANPATAVDPSAAANPYANSAQNPYMNPFSGFGYYDPNNGNLYMNGNPYAGYNSYGNYGAFGNGMYPFNPMLMMGQQTPNYPFPQGFGQGYGPGYGQGGNGFPPEGEMGDDIRPSPKKGKPEVEEEKKPGSDWTMQRLMPLHVSSPLGETLFKCAKTLSPFNTPTGPDRGCGQPLMMRSWQDHPYYFGGFVGYIYGSELVENMIDQNGGANGGLKLGYYFNDYWGVESRLHFASVDIKETAYGRQVYDAWYAATYPDAPYTPLTTRSNHLTTFDVSVQYYPLGNAKWRPYFTYGLGVARESFIDTYGVNNRVDAITMPIGVGLRYWWNEHLAIQGDIVDNIVFSTGQAKTQSNFAFTVGVAYSFGTGKKCRPTAYWPYTPSMGSKW